jgi:hypothetical protein
MTSDISFSEFLASSWGEYVSTPIKAYDSGNWLLTAAVLSFWMWDYASTKIDSRNFSIDTYLSDAERYPFSRAARANTGKRMLLDWGANPVYLAVENI